MNSGRLVGEAHLPSMMQGLLVSDIVVAEVVVVVVVKE